MPRIAIIEDIPDNRFLLRLILEGPYEIDEYSCGLDALEQLPEHLPDLVFLDVSLPDLDGPEVLARLRADERTRHLPVIAYTAHAMRGDRDNLLAAGFDDYISKPIQGPQQVLSLVEKYLVSGRS